MLLCLTIGPSHAVLTVTDNARGKLSEAGPQAQNTAATSSERSAWLMKTAAGIQLNHHCMASVLASSGNASVLSGEEGVVEP